MGLAQPGAARSAERYSFVQDNLSNISDSKSSLSEISLAYVRTMMILRSTPIRSSSETSADKEFGGNLNAGFYDDCTD